MMLEFVVTETRMPQPVLRTAADLLSQHYGPGHTARPIGEWLTLVEVVMEQGGPAKTAPDWSWVDETPLRTPAEAAAETGPRLTALLDAAGHRGRHAGALPSLAGWWLRRFGRGGANAEFRQRS